MILNLKRVCLFVCPRRNRRKEKNLEAQKRGKKQLSSFHTEDCCTTDYQHHLSLPPRERQRDRDRDFVVVVKKKKTTGFEREK